jgi:hypothetical protein
MRAREADIFHRRERGGRGERTGEIFRRGELLALFFFLCVLRALCGEISGVFSRALMCPRR